MMQWQYYKIVSIKSETQEEQGYAPRTDTTGTQIEDETVAERETLPKKVFILFFFYLFF